MAMLFLVGVLVAQLGGDSIAVGDVVDENGKAIGGARVVLCSPPSLYGKGESIEAEGVTDADGKFRFNVPPLGRLLRIGVNVWVRQPGMAVGAVKYEGTKAHHVSLRAAEPRRVIVEGPDGKPIAGAKVRPRSILMGGGTAGSMVPDGLAATLETTTGKDGRATLNYLRGRDRLVAARVTADSIGDQEVAVADVPGQGTRPSACLITLKKTSRLSGRIVDEHGKGVAGQVVEIWSRGSSGRLLPSVVGFGRGPLRTGSDGEFQTPDNLFVGVPYRVAVREPGKEPIVSDWTPIKEGPVTVGPFVLLSLRTVGGRVIDQQGKAVASAVVFQSGDGPKLTEARTDVAGRFALAGFPCGTAVLFTQAEGFRFHGQVLKPGEDDVTVELTRTGERPKVELKKLADAIPIDESRKMVRGILEKWWNAAALKKDDGAKFFVIQFLIPADPVSALQKIGEVKFPTEKSRARLQSLAARRWRGSDFEEAESVAESITDAGVRAGTLARLADLLPAEDNKRKLAILERALVHAKAASTPSERVSRSGDVAVRLLELGEVEKAKTIFAEGLSQAKGFKDTSVGAQVVRCVSGSGSPEGGDRAGQAARRPRARR